MQLTGQERDGQPGLPASPGALGLDVTAGGGTHRVPSATSIQEPWPLPSTENSLVDKQAWPSHQRPRSQQAPGQEQVCGARSDSTHLPVTPEAWV